jgi:hypothetical protein
VFASSCSLLIRCNLAAFRQEIHLSGCSNFPSHLFSAGVGGFKIAMRAIGLISTNTMARPQRSLNA